MFSLSVIDTLDQTKTIWELRYELQAFYEDIHAFVTFCKYPIA